jgi:hypothetical protein
MSLLPVIPGHASLFTSLQVWFRIFHGWVHRSLQDVIAFLVEENRLLM